MKTRKRLSLHYILAAITFTALAVFLSIFLPLSGALWQEVLTVSGEIHLGEPPPVLENCSYSYGYWKTHPEAWQTSEITLGSQTYTQDEAIEILNTPPKGDATFILAYQLIGAKLNVLHGADDTLVKEYLAAADDWLISFPIGSKPKNEERKVILFLAEELEKFNLGELGSPHCGDEPILLALVPELERIPIETATQTNTFQPTDDPPIQFEPIETTAVPTETPTPTFTATMTAEMESTEETPTPEQTETDSVVEEPTSTPTPTPTSTLEEEEPPGANPEETQEPEPTETFTPTPTPTDTPTLPPEPPDEFYDDFSNNDNAWETGEKEEWFFGFDNETYTIMLKQPELFLPISIPIDIKPYPKDLIIEVKAGAVETQGAYGILCHLQNHNNYYQFAISGSSFSLGKRVNGEWTELTQPFWQENEQIHPDIKTGGLNVVHVECTGTLLRFVVNGQELIALEDNNLTNGRAALFADSIGSTQLFDDHYVKIVFDDIHIQFP